MSAQTQSASPTSQLLRRAREVALWVLYGLDVVDRLVPGALDDFYPIAEDLDAEVAELWPEVETRVDGVVDKRPQLDEEIQRVSTRWRLERMAAIDRNLLRLGAWELFHGEVAPIVVINACVELAKEYGEQGSPGFINGLLDQLCKDHGIEVSAQRA